jgi:long-chain fatty acid transport protein
MRSTLTVVIAACLVLTTASALQAAGFEVAEQSGRALGNAYAGKAAEAGDASIAFFNPAGMTRFTALTGSSSVQFLVAGGEFKDRGTTGSALGMTGLVAVDPSGNDGGDPGGVVFIPCINVVMPIDEQFFVGLTINAPYGLTTDYSKKWVGRYHALESHLETMSINPSVAYKLNDQFSFGLGVTYQRAEAKLSNAIDFGTIGVGTLGPATAGALGLSPEANDGKAVIEGDNWAWGWNLGVMFELSETTRFGLAYRSKIFHKLQGDVDFKVPDEAAPLTSTGMFTDSDATARITLPEQIYLSGYHELDDEWALLADITWTAWSQFRELRAQFDSPHPDTVTPEKWDDVFRFSVGANYKPIEDWCFRAGLAIDQSPIPSKYRTPRIPTGDRTWLAFGASYDVSDTIVADASFMYVFIDHGSINDDAVTGQTLKGKFEGFAYILGLNLTMSF